jgi:hypothetical protein
LTAASFALSRSITTWYFATQVASSAGVCIIRAALALSTLAGVITAGSALRLWLHSKPESEKKKQNKLV